MHIFSGSNAEFSSSYPNVEMQFEDDPLLDISFSLSTTDNVCALTLCCSSRQLSEASW